MSRPLQESWALVAIKAALYMAAAWLYLRTLASGAAIGASMVGVALACVAARSSRARLRAGAAVGVAGLAFLAAFVIGEWLLDSTGLWMGLPPRPTLFGADMAFFGLMTFGVVFLLRDLTGRARLFSVFEAALVVGAVVYTFAGHRNLTLDQPRFFSDWVWSTGRDPQIILRGLGVAVAGLAVLMLLETQRLIKLLTSLLTLIVLGGLVYTLIKDVRIEPAVDTGGLGLTKNEKKDKGKSDGKDDKDGKGGGAGDGLSGGSPPSPDPVAVAVFHATYDPPNGLLYFRQQVQSYYDGNHLVPDPERRYDTDVIVDFPQRDLLLADPAPADDFSVQVPTSMYLLVDHPQPLGLSHSVEIGPRRNPDPRRFVATYSVLSKVPNMPLNRLVGRDSVGGAWDAEQRAHYLATPDDPRYQALAEEILRDVDPRFMNDDLMKALMIKRHLEKNGFYTRSRRYEDTDDPTAAFLFGDLHGYCVHFAHSAALLFRSMGIASRVAVGYAVDTRLQGGGSTIVILADRAHAWPEIHLDGVGWVTFDIYPEQSDEVPQTIISRSLESLMGEIARGDETGGVGADPDGEPWEVPWAAMGWGALLTMLTLLLLAYLIKLGRLLLARRGGRRAFAATLDQLADVGLIRARSETRERFAARLAPLAPSLDALTLAHLRAALGPGDDADLQALRREVRAELRSNLPPWRRLVGALNPIGWIFTR